MVGQVGCLVVRIRRLLRKDVLFEEAILDKLFQVLPEGPTMDDLVSLTVMIGEIFLCSGECGIVPDCRGRLTYGWSLMVLKTSLMGSHNKVSHRLIESKLTWRKDRERLPPVSGLPPIPILVKGCNFVLQLRLFTVVVALVGVVDRSLHRFL